jgi:hypothetical protein
MPDPGESPAPCRACAGAANRLVPIIDFGRHPHASSFPLPDDGGDHEPRWPLVVVFCEACFAVQLAGDVPEEPVTIGQAPWTTAESLERQARGLVAETTAQADATGLGGPIVEAASHANYLQPIFREGGRRSLVIERTPAVALHAATQGVDVLEADLAETRGLDSWIGRVPVYVDHYALAHHPSPDRAMDGVAALLAPGGAAIFEFDSLLPSLESGEFDGFRHGHFAYWSLVSLSGLLERHGLIATAVTVHPVYGGVLRVVARRAADRPPLDASVGALLGRERDAGLEQVGTYGRFRSAIETTCTRLRQLLDGERAAGGRVAAYGAPSRGNTLLNACAISSDRIEFTVDRAPWKQGRVLPGSGIPIKAPAALNDGIGLALILTWDIAEEVARDLRAQPGSPPRLAVPFPQVGLLADPSAVRS